MSEQITYMGKREWPVPHRDIKGRFSITSWFRHKWNLAMLFVAWMWKLIKIAAVSFTVLSIAVLGGIEYGRGDITAMGPQTVFAGITDADQLKEKVLNEMVACENPEHFQVWVDDNEKHTLPKKDKVSIGDLAFKLSTIQRMYKTLHDVNLTDSEAMTLGLDPKQARELAIDSWVTIKGSVWEWTCATDSMATRIEDIRILSQNNI